MRIHLCTTIGASADVVWRAIEDIETHTEWMADAESITFRSSQRQGVGTEFECVTRVGPLTTTDVMRITDWKVGSAMGIEHRGLVTGSGRFTLAAVGLHLTEFCWTEELHFPARLGGPLGARLGKPVLERIWRANLARLRTHAEAYGSTT
jgi:carbon monoxide dehydrogenase subunit G